MSEPIPSPARLKITVEAAARLRSESDFTHAVLTVRHLLGCGGSGFRISVDENAPDEGHSFEASGIPVVMDELSYKRLEGAVLDVDPDPAGDGFRLEHPNAVLTTFC
jgi:Fe-S cluster assembly iron-binding protein IscA